MNVYVEQTRIRPIKLAGMVTMVRNCNSNRTKQLLNSFFKSEKTILKVNFCLKLIFLWTLNLDHCYNEIIRQKLARWFLESSRIWRM